MFGTYRNTLRAGFIPAFQCPVSPVAAVARTSGLSQPSSSSVAVRAVLMTPEALTNNCAVTYIWNLRMFKDGEEVEDYEGNRSSESLVTFAKDHEQLG